MRLALAVTLITALAACAATAPAPDASPPAACTADVNARLAELIDGNVTAPIDGVMACGTTLAPSRPQRAGAHGGHQLIPLRVPLPGGRTALVEVVTNDALDGRVTAPRGATVFALGQYFHTSDRQRPFVAGLHDVHCATHRGAANGYVVVNRVRYPSRGCGF